MESKVIADPSLLYHILLEAIERTAMDGKREKFEVFVLFVNNKESVNSRP